MNKGWRKRRAQSVWGAIDVFQENSFTLATIIGERQWNRSGDLSEESRFYGSLYKTEYIGTEYI